MKMLLTVNVHVCKKLREPEKEPEVENEAKLTKQAQTPNCLTKMGKEK